MDFLAPFSETVRGFKAYPEGLRWLRSHPRYLGMLAVPWLLGLVALVAGISAFSTYDETLVGWALFTRPESWWMLALWYLCRVLLYVSLFVLVALASFLLVSVVASPIYEVISEAIERELTGRDTPPFSLAHSLRVAWLELKKVSLILVISLLLLFLPGVNVISTLISAFLVGWDFYDYPLARRGWPLGRRLRFVGTDFWAVLGFGLWLVIPVVQFAMMPLAVAGGTLLNLRALERSGQLQTAWKQPKLREVTDVESH